VSAIDVAPLESVLAATPRTMSSPGPPARFAQRTLPSLASRTTNASSPPALMASMGALSSGTASLPSNQPATAISPSPSDAMSATTT
jgi:hypothetical protein